MDKPNIDMDRVAHGDAPSVLTELTRAIAGVRHSPNLVYHCAIVAAFLCLGAGIASLKWGSAEHSLIIVWSGLGLFMLSFVIWAAIGIAVLWMLRGFITDFIDRRRREHP